jgi:hypothetical protein
MESPTSCYRNTYFLHNRTFVKVKQVIENHIRVEEANVTTQDHYYL